MSEQGKGEELKAMSNRDVALASLVQLLQSQSVHGRVEGLIPGLACRRQPMDVPPTFHSLLKE